MDAKKKFTTLEDQTSIRKAVAKLFPDHKGDVDMQEFFVFLQEHKADRFALNTYTQKFQLGGDNTFWNVEDLKQLAYDCKPRFVELGLVWSEKAFFPKRQIDTGTKIIEAVIEDPAYNQEDVCGNANRVKSHSLALIATLKEFGILLSNAAFGRLTPARKFELAVSIYALKHMLTWLLDSLHWNGVDVAAAKKQADLEFKTYFRVVSE